MDQERQKKLLAKPEHQSRFFKWVDRIVSAVIWGSMSLMFLGLVVLPTVVPLIIGFVIGLTADAYPPRFYEVTAGVIPILFLALAIDLRAFGLSYGKPKGWDENAGMRVFEATIVLAAWLTASALLALVLGEMISLLAVGSENSPGKIAQGIVLGGCFSGVAMIATAALARERTAAKKAKERD